ALVRPELARVRAAAVEGAAEESAAPLRDDDDAAVGRERDALAAGSARDALSAREVPELELEAVVDRRRAREGRVGARVREPPRDVPGELLAAARHVEDVEVAVLRRAEGRAPVRGERRDLERARDEGRRVVPVHEVEDVESIERADEARAPVARDGDPH